MRATSSPPHTKKTKENKREERNARKGITPATFGTSSRYTLATYTDKAKQLPPTTATSRDTSTRQEAKDQTPATRRRKQSTHQQGKNKKNEATRL